MLLHHVSTSDLGSPSGPGIGISAHMMKLRHKITMNKSLKNIDSKDHDDEVNRGQKYRFLLHIFSV